MRDRARRRMRREPPRFRQVEVARTERLTPHMVRVTLTGEQLAGLTIEQPAASVRLLLPTGPAGRSELVTPTWEGNEFLLPDGRRPTIRTFTPRRVDPGALEIDLDVVLHGTGAASEWAEKVEPGHRAALSGPGRGYEVDVSAPAFLLAGDQTALPAISQLLEVLPEDRPVQVLVEVAAADARMTLPSHPRATVAWLDLPPGATPGEALFGAVSQAEITPETRIWVAGEAAAVQRIRRHFFDDRGHPRALCTIRGYWKHGRTGE